MARSKIPKSARRSLKRALVEDGGKVADSTKEGLNDLRKTMRRSVRDGEINRTKITWSVAVGDLVKVKSASTRDKLARDYKKGMPVYGIVTYKHSRITYNNQEDEYIVVMTPNSAELKVHPKQVEVINN